MTAEAVATALAAIGAHPHAPFEVVSVVGDDDVLYVKLAFAMRAATPLCCGELGCYVRFLGLRRREVPAALGARRVIVRASVRYEPGYRFTGLALAPEDYDVMYDADHFA